MRFSVKRGQKRWQFMAVLVLIMGTACYSFWLMEMHLKPTLLAIAEAKANFIATQAINHVIHEKVSTSINPQDLVHIQLDGRGRVVFIQPNTMEFNKIAADTTIKVQERLHVLEEETIDIPMGQMLGSQLLASIGPKIRVAVIPVGTVQVKVIDTFEQAGINQTRHMVYLAATTEIKIVVPLVSKSIRVETQVPIAEYVVVGDVPGTFVQLPCQPR